MIFSEKLQLIRKSRGVTQEELAGGVGVSRQSVAKWESGQAYPEIDKLIMLSDMFHVSVDHLVRDDECSAGFVETNVDDAELAAFLIRAKQKTYAGHGCETEPSRPASHDLHYSESDYLYIDTYLGGERFSGEEAVWKSGVPVYAMNYSGRVTGEGFSGDFLKAALRKAPQEKPFRGPAAYSEGDYSYSCRVEGDMRWFQGYEEICCLNSKVYDCYFHGGIVR